MTAGKESEVLCGTEHAKAFNKLMIVSLPSGTPKASSIGSWQYQVLLTEPVSQAVASLETQKSTDLRALLGWASRQIWGGGAAQPDAAWGAAQP